MANWKKFERDCLQFLRKTYPNSQFHNARGENPNISDIFVVKPRGSFIIETKSPSAQCGQFVLLPNKETRKFEYSPRNKTPIYNETEMIISVMEQDFDRFVSAGTKGETIDISSNISFEWVRKYYHEKKGVWYFISFFERAGEYIISPINNLEEYFTIAAVYREKRSGSRAVSGNNRQILRDLLIENDIEATLHETDRNLEVVTSANLDGERFVHDSGITFFFRVAEADNTYAARILSNTSNSNVIFSINAISEQNPDDLLTFERDLYR